MKILVYNYEYPPLGGGAGRACARIAEYLVRAGHTVRVVTSAWGDRRGRNTENGVDLVRLPALRTRQDRCNPFEMAAYMASAAAWTAAHAGELRGGVTLAFFGLPGGPPALLLRKLARSPYLVSLRGGDVPGFRFGASPAWMAASKPILRAVWRHAHRLVANSRSLAGLADQFVPGCRPEVIPNGVDCEAYRPRESARAPGPFRVVAVGRFRPQKDFGTLIRAAARQRPGAVEVRFVGDGPERSRLEALATKEHVSAVFRGWLDPAGVADELRSADAFALLSHDEGMANVLLEALASGLPVITTDLPPNREVVGEGLAGATLVPEGDAAATAQALSRLISANGELAVLGRRARGRALEFSWDEVGRRYEALLSAALETPGGASRCAPQKPTLPPMPLDTLELVERYAKAFAHSMARPLTVTDTPVHIQLEPSSFCNLDCAFCSRSKVIKNPRNMKLEEFDTLLRELRPHKITLSGYGEPLIHPRFPELVARAKRFGADVNTTSNGILLTPIRAEAIIRAGLDLLSVSLDASRPATYAAIRGEDSHAVIVENLRQFVALRARLGTRKPFLRLCFVVTGPNLPEIPEFVDLAADLPADSVLFQILELTGIEERKGFLAGSIHRDELEKFIALGAERARVRGITTNLRRLGRAIDACARKYEQNIDDHKKCPLPFFSTYVTAAGDLMPCCKFAPTPVAMGNLFRQGAEGAWNGERYRNLRAAFRAGERPFPICKNCIPESVAEIAARAPVSPGFLTPG